MADTYTIQFRRGMYADFDTSKIRPGEPVAILGNDPSVPSGKALYIAFAANDVRRLCSIEDISEMVNAGEFVGPQGPKGDNMSDEQAAQIEQNKTDIASLKEETGLLKNNVGSYVENYLKENPATDSSVKEWARKEFGSGLIVTEDGRLSVDTVNTVEENNMKPITSDAVYKVIGNIETALAAI